jgi:hypothetical protein
MGESPDVSEEYEGYRQINYHGETYLNVDFFLYILKLDGNGGTTDDGETTHDAICSIGTPGWLQLYYQKDVFTNEGHMLIGWSDTADSDTGTMYSLDTGYWLQNKSSDETLYAQWDDDTHTAVILDNYYGWYDFDNTGYYSGGSKTVAARTDKPFTLPTAYRGGYALDGWLSEDGNIYPAGTEVDLTGITHYTAQYSPLTIEVDGVTYSAYENHGGESSGWRYYCGYATDQLNIYENYSGGSIKLPESATIYIQASFSGSDSAPAIYVDGDATVRFEEPSTFPLTVSGGANAPAIIATGDLKIEFDDPETETDIAFLSSGSADVPAFTAGGTIEVKDNFCVGQDEDSLKYAETYQGEPLVKVTTIAAPSVETTSKPTSNGGGGGGGSMIQSFPVSVTQPDCGTLSASPASAAKGAAVTVTASAQDGYQVDGVTVTDKNGNAISVTDAGNGTYTFTMPDSKVTVSATVSKKPAEVVTPTPAFTDVPADAYYVDAVTWAVEKGITNGMSDTAFKPNSGCTRAQVVTFLWRAAGEPAADGSASFGDVSADDYYATAVAWAVEQDITNGTSEDAFSPDATCTRGQIVTFLARYAQGKASTADTGFADVTSDSYYADAVAWAVENGITNGITATTFAPDTTCTRSQVITFLYRAAAE